MEYVSRVPRPPLDGLIDDLYYLEGTPPYARLTLPPMPAALLIVNLGAPLRIRAGTDIETAEYDDGCAIATPTRAYDFGYPVRTRSVGVHVKPWGLAPFLPMPAAELCDRPVTVEQVWGRSAVAVLRDRLASADTPQEVLTVLEEELARRLRATVGLGLVRHASSVITATRGAVAIGDLSMAAGVSSTHLAQRFKALVGVTPKRLARISRFAATVHRPHADPVHRGPAAVPPRTSRPCAGQRAAAGGLIFCKNVSSRHANLSIRNVRQQRSAPWARWSCTARCQWTASSPT